MGEWKFCCKIGKVQVEGLFEHIDSETVKGAYAKSQPIR